MGNVLVNAWTRVKRDGGTSDRVGGEERCLCARWWAVRRICRPGVRNRDIEFTPFLFWRIAACDTIRRGFISGRPRGSDFFILTNSLLRFIGFQRNIRRREIKRARERSLPPPPPYAAPSSSGARCRQSESKAKSLKDIHRFTVPFRIARLEGLFLPPPFSASPFQLLSFFRPRRRAEDEQLSNWRLTFLLFSFCPSRTIDLSVRSRPRLESRIFTRARADRFAPRSISVYAIRGSHTPRCDAPTLDVSRCFFLLSFYLLMFDFSLRRRWLITFIDDMYFIHETRIM